MPREAPGDQRRICIAGAQKYWGLDGFGPTGESLFYVVTGDRRRACVRGAVARRPKTRFGRRDRAPPGGLGGGFLCGDNGEVEVRHLPTIQRVVQ